MADENKETHAASPRRTGELARNALDWLLAAGEYLPDHWRSPAHSRWVDVEAWQVALVRLEARARRRGETLMLAELHCRNQGVLKAVSRALGNRARQTDVICETTSRAVRAAGGFTLSVLMPHANEANAAGVLASLFEPMNAIHRPTVVLHAIPEVHALPEMPRVAAAVRKVSDAAAVHSAA